MGRARRLRRLAALGPVILVALGTALAGAFGPGPGLAAEPCATPPGFVADGRVVSEHAAVLFRTVPGRIEVGRAFAVEVVACSTPSGAPASGLRVDAQMPEHRHGMNYRPRISALADGRWLAEGLLFHMPGRWQILLEVERRGQTERLATEFVVE